MDSTPQPSKISRILKFVKESFDLILHPIKSAQKQIEARRLKEHIKKMETDPDYLDEVLDPKKPVKEAPGGFSIGNLMGSFIVLLIGTSLFGTINSTITNVIETNSALAQSQLSLFLLKSVPYVFVGALMIIGGITFLNGLKRGGII